MGGKIETERLDVDVEPPDDQDYVLVEKVASGEYIITQAAGSTSVGRHGPFSGRDDAITTAKEYAQRIGLDRIFIRGF